MAKKKVSCGAFGKKASKETIQLVTLIVQDTAIRIISSKTIKAYCFPDAMACDQK